MRGSTDKSITFWVGILILIIVVAAFVVWVKGWTFSYEEEEELECENRVDCIDNENGPSCIENKCVCVPGDCKSPKTCIIEQGDSEGVCK